MAESFNRPFRMWDPKGTKTDGLVYMDTAKPMPFTLPIVTTQTYTHPFWPMPEQRLLPGQKPFHITEIPMHVADLNDSELTAKDVHIHRLTKEGFEQELMLNWQFVIRNWNLELPFLTDVGATTIYDAFHRFGQVRVSSNEICIELGSHTKKVFTIALTAGGNAIESNHPMYGGGKVDPHYPLPYIHRRSGYGRSTFSIIAGMLPGEDNMVLSYNLEYDTRLMKDPMFFADVVGMPYDKPEFIRPYIHPYLQIKKLKKS